MYSNNEETRTFVASGDLSGLQFRVVDLVGQFKVGHGLAGRGIGVLQNKPASGEHATVAIRGEVQVRVGSGGVTAGDRLSSTLSGWAQTITASDFGIYDQIGRALTTASSGHIATIELNVTRTSS
jgi:hypothetical protein